MLSTTKKIIALFVLTSFLTIIFFNFAVMMHEPDGSMQGNCPFSSMGVSLCPQDILAMAFHHISAYNSLLNVPVNFGITTLIISFFLIASVILAVFIDPSLFGPPVLAGILFNTPPDTSYKRKIISWLALRENSPAIF